MKLIRLPNLFMIVIGLIVLIFLANSILSSKAVPSLGDYIASSTTELASSTPISLVRPAQLASIVAPKGTIYAEIASTTDEQETGLSYRASLTADHGMLFVFPVKGSYGFWMKDMHFPLDMVWIDSAKTVAGLVRGATADSYPTVFVPPRQILYVLEINAGEAQKMGIATGTQLSF